MISTDLDSQVKHDGPCVSLPPMLSPVQASFIRIHEPTRTHGKFSQWISFHSLRYQGLRAFFEASWSILASPHPNLDFFAN